MKLRSVVEAVDVEVYDLARVGVGKEKVTAFFVGPAASGAKFLLLLVTVLLPLFRACSITASGRTALWLLV